MAQGSKTHMVKLKTVMHTAAFVRGFKEVLSGIPMDYDVYNDSDASNDRFSYERGRMFGHVYNGKLKNGRRVTYEALAAMNDAVYNRVVI
jgi:hypothetical protein